MPAHPPLGSCQWVFLFDGAECGPVSLTARIRPGANDISVVLSFGGVVQIGWGFSPISSDPFDCANVDITDDSSTTVLAPPCDNAGGVGATVRLFA